MFFPPGEYYVGDLCYVLDYHSILSQRLFAAWEEADWQGVVELRYQGHPVWDAWTAYGDGAYTDNEGRAYGVDSGTIGVVPLAVCDAAKIATLNGLGHVLTFTQGYEPRWDRGVFTFGHTIINTRGEEEEA